MFEKELMPIHLSKCCNVYLYGYEPGYLCLVLLYAFYNMFFVCPSSYLNENWSIVVLHNLAGILMVGVISLYTDSYPQEQLILVLS